MELGNLMFGHSRGHWEVPRDERYAQPLRDIIVAVLRSQGFPGWSKTTSEVAVSGHDVPTFENEVFSIHPYDWDAEPPEETGFLPPANFEFKDPAGRVELRWYKYPLRDAYMSKEVGPDEWRRICDLCVASCPPAVDHRPAV